MAWSKPLFTIPGATAADDLSTKQFHCVKQTSTGINVCATDGEIFDGVLGDKPNAAGKACEVLAAGVAKVVAAETLTKGDRWGTDANGKAKKVETTLTGADVGDYFAGTVLEGAGANEIATVTIGFTTGLVEAQ